MKKIWMITGASRGFGAKIAEAVLIKGDILIATARNQDSLNAIPDTKETLKLSLDVTHEDQAIAAVHEAVKKFGRIDVLINNAGYGLLGAVEESSAEEVEAIFRTNVFGLLNVTRSVLPIMRRQRSGHIINLSSMAGYQTTPILGIYGATKFAVEGISEALSAETRAFGIHVTAIGPGFFRTDFVDDSSLQHTKTRIDDYSAMTEKTRSFAKDVNHKQMGDPVKLAEVVMSLIELSNPPLRLPLGLDALKRLETKSAFVQEEMKKWLSLSESTEFSK